MSLSGREQAPAGALTPSTVRLRVFSVLTIQNSPILCVYNKKAVMYFQKIRVSLFGREKAPAGALTPSTELFVSTTYKSCLYYI